MSKVLYISIPKNFAIFMCCIAMLIQGFLITKGRAAFVACARVALPVYDYNMSFQRCLILETEVAI